MYFKHLVSFKSPAIVSLPSTAVHVTSTIFNTVADEVSTTPGNNSYTLHGLI